MAVDFSGTNTEKIDKLIVATIELRTTVRLCMAVVGLGFPLMVGLLSFLIVQSFSTAAKVDRLNDQIITVRTDTLRLADRLEQIERPHRP